MFGGGPLGPADAPRGSLSLDATVEGSLDLDDRSLQHLAGGSSTLSKRMSFPGDEPPLIARGKGCRVWDLDGNEYIDYMCGYGSMILGYGYDLVDEAASRIRMEIDSKPEAMDRLERRLIQLKIEREALNKESDEASRKRLEALQHEIDHCSGLLFIDRVAGAQPSLVRWAGTRGVPVPGDTRSANTPRLSPTHRS